MAVKLPKKMKIKNSKPAIPSKPRTRTLDVVPSRGGSSVVKPVGVNSDGLPDIFSGGNVYNTSPFSSRVKEAVGPRMVQGQDYQNRMEKLYNAAPKGQDAINARKADEARRAEARARIEQKKADASAFNELPQYYGSMRGVQQELAYKRGVHATGGAKGSGASSGSPAGPTPPSGPADWSGLGTNLASNFSSNGGFAGMMAPAVQGALIGGVGMGVYESATGGSFWEGAKTGAFYGGAFGAGRYSLRAGVGAKHGQGTWEATGKKAQEYGVGVKSILKNKQNTDLAKQANGLK